MKFLAAMLVYMGFGLAVVAGLVLLAATGQWWLLVLASGCYLLGLYNVGLKQG